MARPSKIIDTAWTSEFAYAVGLITTDGNLSPDGRHISFTTKDRQLAQLYHDCLGLDNAIGRKGRGSSLEKPYFVVQFGSVQFYAFLLSIGLHPAKSHTLGALQVPDKLFFDFLRGCVDGDGTIGSFSHPESIHPQIRLRLASASPVFLAWIHRTIRKLVPETRGWITHLGHGKVDSLEFGTKDSLALFDVLYRNGPNCCLVRKYRSAEKCRASSRMV
jgi:hypothetical protein